MNDRSIIELIYSAKQNRIDVVLNEGQLQVKLPKDKSFDKSIFEKLKENKDALAAFLKKNDRGTLSNYKIEKFNRAAVSRIPLSFSQERLWFIDQLEGSVQYHISSVLRIKGKLNIDALTFALKAIINRHEVLKTVFKNDEGEAYQEVLKNTGFNLIITDNEAYNNATIPEAYIRGLINKPFDLSKDLMLRADLIALHAGEYIMVLTMHHIASDGWSSSILVREVMELYRSYIENREANLIPLPIQYADYAVWQRNFFAGETINKKLSYWKDKLDGVLPLQLYTDYTRPVFKSNSGSFLNFSLDKEVLINLQKLNQQQQVTMFMTLLAVFKILLFKYCNQHDVCVGTATANRSNKEVENLIGFFINTLALRSTVDEDYSFADLLQQVKLNTLNAFENAEIPFEKVVDAVVKERDVSINPLFQVMFVLQNTPPVPAFDFADTAFLNEPFSNNTSKFDLTLNLSESPSGITGFIQYANDLFNAATIDRMMAHYRILINSVVKDPFKKIKDLQLLSQDEERQLLIDFNSTSTDYPYNSSVVDLFEKQVQKTPGKIALVFEDEEVSYKELNARSNQLAHYLMSLGVGEETLVPICAERSVELMVGIIGILKARAAYVPIDVHYPEERIRFILEDTNATVVVTNQQNKLYFINSKAINIVELNSDYSIINQQPSANLPVQIKPHNLAYVIYTSGSTGKPKGVLVEHANVVSLVAGVNYVTISRDDVLLSTGSPSFDATTFEYWSMLLNGGQLILCSENTLLNSLLLKEQIERKKVTKMWFTSSWFNQLVETDITVFASLQTILVGGEKLSEQHIHKFKQAYPAIQIINGYGPTENTTFSLTFSIAGSDTNNSIPIGRPLSNRTAFILNQQQHLQPVGVVGEIYVGGAGIARGYLNRNQLTEEKFVQNPFNKQGNRRLYKTGDLGRWLPNGCIEYIGRIDDQVKIRGYRIELGEIESVLQQSGQVSQALVLVNTDAGGHKRLVGYVIGGESFNKQEIQSYLQGKLPEYMVPALWVQMENFPLTSNGKIDKKALPNPDITEQLTDQYVAPKSEFEMALAAIWKELLQVARVGIHDNFFELGGDSIITIQVVSRAKRVGISLKPKDLFVNQTIAKLSAALTEGTEKENEAEQGFLAGTAGLIPIQQWYFQKSGHSVSYFNQSVLLSIDKEITTQQLQDAFDYLTEHHDSLRFSYSKHNENWLQQYGSFKGNVIIEDLQTSPKLQLSALITARATFYQSSLNIEKGELIQMVLMKTPPTEPKNRLFIVIHHLAVDGVSWRILLEDLELLLSSSSTVKKNRLPAKTYSYRQWYNALEDYGKSNGLLSQKSYWHQVANSYQPLSIKNATEEVIRAKDVFTYTNQLTTEHTIELLQDVPRVFHTEINDILLCALAKTICSWTNNENIVIALEGHGREHIKEDVDTSRTVGWFTTIFPVMLGAERGKSNGELIKTVKEQLRQIPDKGLGFGVLKYINHDEMLSGNNFYDIVFNYLGRVDNTVKESKLFEIADESTGQGMSSEQVISEKLGINSFITSNKLVLNWSYSTKHFEEKTIKALADSYLKELTSLIAYCIAQGKSGAVYTPSDFGLGSSVSYEELDSFLEEDNLDNIMSF